MSILAIIFVIGLLFLIIGILGTMMFGLKEDITIILILSGIIIMGVVVGLRLGEISNEPQIVYACNIDFNNSSDENIEVNSYEIRDNIFIATYEDTTFYLHLRDNDSISCTPKE